MFDTLVPGTHFSFGALYMFVMIVSVFTFLVRVVSDKDKEG